MFVANIERGCGRRKKGGIYAELGVGKNGRPVEDFLIDPTVLPPFDVPALGMKPFSDPRGVVHLADWVGEEHYPNLWDFIEEVRQFGLSRRISSSAPFDLLTRDSRIMTVHKTAYVFNRAEMPHRMWLCPTGKHHAGEIDEMCIGLPRMLVEPREGDEVIFPATEDSNYDVLKRVMPSFTYQCGALPAGFEPVWQGAIFAAFPIARFSIVQGGTADEMERAQQALNKARLPVVEVES